jgi:hypothetical protein
LNNAVPPAPSNNSEYISDHIYEYYLGAGDAWKKIITIDHMNL